MKIYPLYLSPAEMGRGKSRARALKALLRFINGDSSFRDLIGLPGFRIAPNTGRGWELTRGGQSRERIHPDHDIIRFLLATLSCDGRFPTLVIDNREFSPKDLIGNFLWSVWYRFQSCQQYFLGPKKVQIKMRGVADEISRCEIAWLHSIGEKTGCWTARECGSQTTHVVFTFDAHYFAKKRLDRIGDDGTKFRQALRGVYMKRVLTFIMCCKKTLGARVPRDIWRCIIRTIDM